MTGRQHFIVIGTEDNPHQDFSGEILRKISAGKVFSGGKRHRELVSGLLPSGALWIDIAVPLEEVFRQYGSYPEIVVFASGDPLFFGFAVTLQNKFPDSLIEVYPAFNSLQRLAHKILLPYHDMRIVSLTGRPWHEFDRALIDGAAKIGILTDREHTPAAIARRMAEYGYTGYLMHVGIHVGHPDKEKISTLPVTEAVNEDFGHPNCIILEQKGENPKKYLGIPERLFEPLDGRINMITKMPVRLLTLSMLDLPGRKVFWDIGSCTGSVSIEAKMQFSHLHITAFEIRPQGKLLMDINSRRFGTPGIECRTEDFLETDISSLPAPDAIFIGGHGGRMEEMIRKVARALVSGGIAVFNSVSPESRRQFIQSAENAGMELSGSTSITVDDHNTIEVLKAMKK